jgi:hypothetical protein
VEEIQMIATCDLMNYLPERVATKPAQEAYNFFSNWKGPNAFLKEEQL